MKNWWMQLLLAAVVAAAVGAVVPLLGDSRRKVDAARGDEDLSALEGALAEARAQQATLAERLAALSSASAPASTRAPVQDLDQAIAEYMARQLTAEGGDAPASDGRAAAPGELEAAAIADRIVSGEVTGDELEALWLKLRQEKRVDAVVAEIERQAEVEPGNPDLQNELGKAYLQKLFDVGVGPMASVWGEKADHAFDRALELDDSHWEARFHKALSLSSAPEFLGLRGEAVRQFEILMERQEAGAASGEQVMTYLFLGNMYAQKGEAEKAQATWQRGLRRFPGNADLLSKTEGK